MFQNRSKIVSYFVILNTFLLFLPLSVLLADKLKKPQKISVVYCNDIVPFHYTGPDGQAEGIMIDFWKLWSKKTGIAVHFIPAPWADTLKTMREGKADAHAGLFYTDERAEYLDYGTTLQKTDTHIFYDKRLPSPENNTDFLPYRTGLIRGDTVEGYLSETLPNLTTVGFNNYEEMMAALKRKELSVFAADTPTSLFHLNKSGLKPSFTYKPNMPLYQSQWYVAVKKGNPGLLKIINKGFESISKQEKLFISRQWATGAKRKNKGELIVAVSSGYAPFSFTGPDGKPAGLLVDIWRLWSRETNIPIAFKMSSWAETLEAVKTGEADIHSGLFKNREREKWFTFSIPIFESDSASYFLSGNAEPVALKDMKGEKVGAMEGSYQEKYFRENFPQIKTVSRPDNESLILSLIKREITAFVHETPVVSADLSRLGLTGLVSRGEILFSNRIYAGVAKGREKLGEKINSGFLSIPVHDLAEIEARWLPNAPKKYYQEKLADIGLTKEEKKWVRANPKIRVAATPNWPPFEFRDKGAYLGLHADMIRLAAGKAGLKVEPVFAKWSDLVAQLKNGTLDLCPGLNATEERKTYLVFTDDYISETSQVIVAPKMSPVHSIEELYGRTVSVEKGYATETFLKENFPEVNLLLVENSLEAIKKLVTGKADAYLGNQAVALYLIKKNAFSGLQVTAFFEQAKRSEYRIGVIDEKAVLRDILQKALSAVTTTEKSALQEKWFGRVLAKDKTGPELNLSDEEKSWLADHPVIRVVMDTDRAPVEFVDDKGNFHGISMDYLQKLSELLNIRFDTVKEMTWQEKRTAVENGKLDLFSSFTQTRGREASCNFTLPHLSVPINIFAGGDVTYIKNLAALEGKRVAVVDGSAVQEWVQGNYPKIKLLPADSVPAALKLVAEKKAYAFVGNIVITSYYISKMRLNQIRVVGETPYKDNQSMAVRKDWPILVNILQKGLEAIPQNEREAIFNRWVSVRYEHGFDYSLLWKVLVPACFIILLFVYWNRKLGREIEVRKKTEKKLSFTQYAMDHAFHSVFWVDPGTGKFIYINEAACTSLGYTRDEILDLAVPQIDVDFPADKLEQFIQALRVNDFIPTKGRHLKKDGTFIDVELTCYLTNYIEGEVIVVFALDITERLNAQRERDEAFQVIRSSIEYASRIQRSVLPPSEVLDRMVKDHFVLWEPRDVVGGDIYWCLEWGQGILIVLADCTGHGVPGAFMTLISSGALERGIIDVPVGDPAALIQKMHQLIQIVLGQDSGSGHSDDGLEMGMCYIHPGRERITFAGAGFPLFKLNGEQMEMIKGKKKGIGYRHIAFDSTWINREIQVTAGDRFYMSSDGIFDQIGGPKRMGFGKKRFKALLTDIQAIPIADQGEKIYQELKKYQGREKRRDDVSAIGFGL